MKLTPKALAAVNTPDIRRELSRLLHCTEQTIIRYIRKNEPNGYLTTVAAVEMIKQLTTLPEREILQR
jgi:hypothetical protein